MTYDRLRPDPDADELFCVKRDADGFTAVAVPPTMTWSPSLAQDRREIRGKETAIQVNPYLHAERRDFLMSRAAYWDTWATRSQLGVIALGDRE